MFKLHKYSGFEDDWSLFVFGYELLFKGSGGQQFRHYSLYLGRLVVQWNTKEDVYKSSAEEDHNI